MSTFFHKTQSLVSTQLPKLQTWKSFHIPPSVDISYSSCLVNISEALFLFSVPCAIVAWGLIILYLLFHNSLLTVLADFHLTHSHGLPNTQITSCARSESHSVIFNSLWFNGLYSPWNSPGQNTGVGSLSLFQRIFPTQGSNPGLPPCGQILYQLSHKGSPNHVLSIIKISQKQTKLLNDLVPKGNNGNFLIRHSFHFPIWFHPLLQTPYPFSSSSALFILITLENLLFPRYNMLSCTIYLGNYYTICLECLSFLRPSVNHPPSYHHPQPWIQGIMWSSATLMTRLDQKSTV